MTFVQQMRQVRFAIQALLSDGELHTVQALGSNMYNSMSTLNIILEFCTGQKMRLLGINRSNDSPSNQRDRIKQY